MKKYCRDLYQKYEQFWSRMAPKFSTDPWHYSSAKPYQTIVDFAKFLKNNHITGKILDIGSGNGRHSEMFAKCGFETCGIDIAPSAVKFAVSNAAKKKLSIKYLCADFLAKEFSPHHFTAIIDCGLLHHLRQSRWTVYKKQIINILKPGGYYFLLIFSDKTAEIKQFGKRHGNWSKRHHHYYHYFSQEEIAKLFGAKLKLDKKYVIKKGEKDIFYNIFIFKKEINL